MPVKVSMLLHKTTMTQKRGNGMEIFFYSLKKPAMKRIKRPICVRR